VFATVKRRTYNRAQGLKHGSGEISRTFVRLPVTWVHDRVFAAGGSHIPANWSSFVEQTQVTSVLHLNSQAPLVFRGPAPRAFLWLGIDDEDQAEWETRRLAGRFLLAELARGGRALIHSAHGRHRTRWAFVSFLLLNGKSVTAALRQVAEAPWLAPYYTDEMGWREFKEWAEGSASARVERPR
jgi:hypothetical protein